MKNNLHLFLIMLCFLGAAVWGDLSRWAAANKVNLNATQIMADVLVEEIDPNATITALPWVEIDPNICIDTEYDPNATAWITVWEPPTIDCPTHGKTEMSTICFGDYCTPSYCLGCLHDVVVNMMKNAGIEGKD